MDIRRKAVSDLEKGKELMPKRIALQVSLLYLLVGFIFIWYFDHGWILISITTVMVYVFLYSILNKVKNLSTNLYHSGKELSATTEGLLVTQEMLEQQQTLFENIFNNSTAVVFTWYIDGTIKKINPYGERVTGYSEEELIGKSWVDLFLQEDEKLKIPGLVQYLKSGRTIKNSIGDVWQTKDGRFIELIWIDSPIVGDGGEIQEILSFGTDITEHKMLLRRLNRLAYYDSLTGLPNRTMLKNEATKLIKNAELMDTKLAFLHIDIDNFKQINDTLGYDAGDEFLVNLAKILNEKSGERNLLAKLSEDGYAIVLYDVRDEKDIIDRTNDILKDIRRPWMVDREEFLISASIGVSIFPDDGNDFLDLMKHSNMAMQYVKSQGKDGYALYRDEMGKKISNNIFMINQIRRAIEEEQFTLHYQPVIEAADESIYGAECLLRWNHPDRGYIPPMDFIPLMEETGQIFDITSLVLKMAFKQKQLLNEKGYQDLNFGVNISSKSLSRGDLEWEIRGLLKEYHISPKEITLEITETAFMNDLDSSIYTLIKLEKLGLEIALDDFGTGYSSLTRLKNLPIHHVKMDQEFIKTMRRYSEEEVIVKSIIELGHSLGLKIIAEGVETEEQLDILKEAECDLAQGYYIGRPMTAEAFEEVLIKDKKVNKDE